MRILHFISSAASGGAEVLVRDLSLKMKEQGHEVMVVFLDRAIETGRSQDFENNYVESLTKSGVSYAFVGKSARRKLREGRVVVSSIIDDFQPDVIHHHLYYSVLLTVKVFQGMGFINVYTRHGSSLRLPKAIFKVICSRIDGQVAINHVNYLMLRSVQPKDKVKLIYNAVNTNRLIINTREFKDNAQQQLNIISVGRLVKLKRFDRLLEALASLSKFSWHLTLVGEGELRQSLTGQVESLGIAERVTFAGNVSNVQDYLAASDIFVLTSDTEGLPISMIEATLSGLPSVTTNVGGCAEVLHRTGSGFVLDVINSDELAKLLESIFSNQSSLSGFSENAIRFSSDFTIDSCANSHLEFYQDLLNKLDQTS